MLCDRCVSNAKCEQFKPGNQCVLEQETFDKVVAELVEEYDLDRFADKILVERAGMYLIHIMRAEAYETTVGMNEKTAYWGTYIGRMDSMLRSLFNDLAINRGKRMTLEKGDGMLVSLDEVIRKFNREEQKNAPLINKDLKMRRVPALSVRRELLMMWENDYPTQVGLEENREEGKEGWREKNRSFLKLPSRSWLLRLREQQENILRIKQLGKSSKNT
jgi:hypothetical protein